MIPEAEESYSITSCWSTRAAQYKNLEHQIQQWCQQDSPTLADLTFPAHFAGAAKANCCTMCKAICELSAHCKSFVASKEEYRAACAVAQKELAKAKKELTEAEKALAEAQEELVEDRVMPSGSSSLNGRILELMTMRVASKSERVSIQANSIEDKKVLNSSKADSVVNRAWHLSHEANLILITHKTMHASLGSLRTIGNNDTTSLDTSESEESSSSAANLDHTRFDVASRSYRSTFDKLFSPSILELQKVDFLQSLTSEQIDLLTVFYKYLQHIFGMASRLENNDAEYRQKIERTVTAIIGWHIGESMETSSTMELYLPSNVGQEVNGVQAILYAIMIKMAQVLDLHVLPHEKQVVEQGVPTDGNYPHRYSDFVGGTSSVEDYLLALLPAMLGIPIEIKPIAQKKKARNVNCLQNAQHQVVQQLAEQALFSLNFGGIGKDCTSIGLVLTMGSVTILVLELSGVGTSDVETNAQRTKRVPLFDKETRKKLFGEKVKYVEALFETEDVSQDMPEGFCLLAQTLASVHHGLITRSSQRRSNNCDSFSLQPDTADSIELGNYLGSGSFSHVLRLVDKKDSNDLCIKLPQFHHVRDCLEREAKALKDLCENDCIPKLNDTDHPIKTLHMNIRCESAAVTCLPMRGLIGRSAMHHRRWDHDKLEFIVLEVYSALEYANSKGWAHLNVQPANIITCVDDPHGTGCIKVMLVDWGCAHRTNQKLRGFIGCSPFAHDDLFHETNDWCPCLEHDVASLAYTMASLCEGGSIPSWHGSFEDRHYVNDEMKERRFKIVRRILVTLLEKGDVSQKVKQALLNAIDHTRST